MIDQRPPAPRAKLIAAFAAVYLIWGSTFLAIRYAIETMPPLLMAGVRFLIAGAMLYAWAAIREKTRPTRAQWAGTAVVGALLLAGGNGAVSWSEQFVPSGLAALVVANTPLWMVIFEWARPGGDRLTPQVVVGLVLGFIGLVLLVSPGDMLGVSSVDPRSAVVLMLGTLAWAFGSIYARAVSMPSSARLSTGMQMLAGGALLVVLGLIIGEGDRVNLGGISLKSALALGYLIVFGAVIGFTAYIWLLTATTAARVSTYAYVNPVVALMLGWLLADEPLNARTIVAAGVILAGVAVITVSRSARPATVERRTGREAA